MFANCFVSRLRLLLPVIGACLVSVGATSQGEEIEVPTPTIQFDDGFERDSRAEYALNGEVGWANQRLTVAPAASVARVVDPTCWLVAELHLIFPATGEKKRAVELQYQFEGQRWSLTLAGNGGKGEMSLRKLEQQEDKPDKVTLIRRWTIPQMKSGSYRVEYRQGMIEVTPPDAATDDPPPFAGHALNTDEPITELRVVASGEEAVGIANWKVAAAPRRKEIELTEEQTAEVEEAKALNSEVFKLFRSGQPVDAIGKAIRVRELVERNLGKTHPNYSQSLNNLAALSQMVGRYKAADPLFQEAIGIRRAMYGKRHPTYGKSLNNLAALKKTLGDMPAAVKLTQTSLGIYERVYGEEHADTATIMNNLAELHRYAGDYALAEPIYRKSLSVLERLIGKESIGYARTLANLGAMHQDAGDPAAGEPLCIQARDIEIKLLGKEHLAYARSTNNLAALSQVRGRYTRAEALYVEALNTYRKLLGNKHPTYASSLSTLSNLYQLMGDHEKAEAPLLEALKIQEKVLGEDHIRYADSIVALAKLYEEMGREAQATKLYLKARDIYERKLGKGHSRYSVANNGLALLYESRNEFEAAEELMQQTRSLMQQAKRTEHADYVGALTNLGVLRTRMGRYEEAEPLFTEAKRIAGTVMGDQHPKGAETLLRLARLRLLTNDLEAAQQLQKEALDVLVRAAENVLPKMSEAQALQWMRRRAPRRDMLLAAMRQAKPKDAAGAYEAIWRTKALASRLRVGASVGAEATPEAKQVGAELRDARLKLARMISATPEPGGAEQFRRRLLAASDAKERLEKELADLNPATERALAVRDATVKQLLAKLPAGVAVIDFVQQDDYRSRPAQIESRKKDGTIETLTTRVYTTTPVYDAFVLRSDRPSGKQISWRALGDAATIDDAIVAWRRSLNGSGEDRGLGAKSVKVAAQEPSEAPGRLLRTRVWDPLQPLLEGCHTVVILPDAHMHRMPWAALPGRQPESYLIEDYAVGVAAYGQQVFALLSDDPLIGNSALIAGGIQYDQRPGETSDPRAGTGTLLASSRSAVREGEEKRNWGFLPGAAAEVKLVADAWPAETPPTQLSGTAADERAIAAAMSRARYVHLATHGFFASPDVKNLFDVDLREQSLFIDTNSNNAVTSSSAAARNPLLLSGVVVAGANLEPAVDKLGVPTGDDGILTAEELAGLPLSNTELVTLSACETGLGDVAAGEGVFGLQRALHQAGVRSVIASLWRVDDQATRALMAEFYNNLWAKRQGKLTALRNAQLAVLGRYDLKTGQLRGLALTSERVDPKESGRIHPRFWAAFQLSGDWR